MHLVVVAIPTELSASHTPPVAAIGADVHLFAMIYPDATAATLPTGTITFLEGETQLCSATVDPVNSWGMCPGKFWTFRDHTYTANYSGDGVYEPSTASWTVTVKHPTSLTLSSKPVGTSVVGQTVNSSRFYRQRTRRLANGHLDVLD